MFLNEWLEKSAGLILIILRLGMHSTLPELHCRLDQKRINRNFPLESLENRVTDWGLGFSLSFRWLSDDGLCF